MSFLHSLKYFQFLRAVICTYLTMQNPKAVQPNKNRVSKNTRRYFLHLWSYSSPGDTSLVGATMRKLVPDPRQDKVLWNRNQLLQGYDHTGSPDWVYWVTLNFLGVLKEAKIYSLFSGCLQLDFGPRRLMLLYL